MDYKEELFNTLEQFLLDNNIYSEFTTYILEHFRLSLSEFFDNCFAYNGRTIYYLFYNHWNNLDIHKKWFRIAVDLRLKYDRRI